MRKMIAEELTIEKYQKYGTFQNMTDLQGNERLGPPPVEFYRDLVPLDLGSGTPCFSVTRISPRPMIAEKFEFHTATGEAFIPLDGDVLVHVAPAGKSNPVPYDKIEAFRVPKGTLVTMRPGVWHAAPFACGEQVVHVMVVLPERTYANDCTVIPFPEEEKIELIEK